MKPATPDFNPHQSRTVPHRRSWRDRPEAPHGRRRREVPEGAGVVCWGCLMFLGWAAIGLGFLLKGLMK